MNLIEFVESSTYFTLLCYRRNNFSVINGFASTPRTYRRERIQVSEINERSIHFNDGSMIYQTEEILGIGSQSLITSYHSPHSDGPFITILLKVD